MFTFAHNRNDETYIDGESHPLPPDFLVLCDPVILRACALLATRFRRKEVAGKRNAHHLHGKLLRRLVSKQRKEAHAVVPCIKG